MAYVIVLPDGLAVAAADLDNIASGLDEVHAAAAPATVALRPAAADEVSVSVARLFSQHAQDYQTAARQAAASQEQFVQKLTSSAASYASAEDLIASLLQALDAKVDYYTTAGIALRSILTNFPKAMLASTFFPLFWPLLPLLPLFFLTQLASLFTDVILGLPISYPYLEP